MIVEGVITFIIAAALFYVAPGVLGSIKTASPFVCSVAGGGCGSVDAGLNSSQAQIGTTVAGGLNLSSISLIMLGIGIMIGGFMLIRGRQ
jgi:hypothetical protein